EDVEALLDRVREMRRAESERRGEDGDVAGLETIEGVLVGVEADESAVLGDFDAIGEALIGIERLVGMIEAILEGIGHGDVRGVDALGAKGIDGGAGTAAAAAYEGDFNG